MPRNLATHAKLLFAIRAFCFGQIGGSLFFEDQAGAAFVRTVEFVGIGDSGLAELGPPLGVERLGED